MATAPADRSDEAQLWREARAEEAGSAREALFSLYLPQARAIAARRFRRRSGPDIEFGDLYQLACAGLLEAIDRYRPGLGVPFGAYASRRIDGSILNGLPKLSEVREQISFRRRVERERIRSLGTGLGAGRSGDPLETLAALATGLAVGFMLEGTGLYCSEGTSSAAGPYENAAWKDVVERVRRELARLPEREASVLRLHYSEGLSFDEVARLSGVTKGRVSQIHKDALGLLRKRLACLAGSQRGTADRL